MTIRDYLKRRTRRIVGIAFAGWLLLPISALVTADEPPTLLMFLAFLLFFGATATLLLFVKCPSCKSRLRQLSGDVAFHWGTRRRVKFCPYCGVNLDNELGAKNGE